jgi:DNA-directed RNA polymerase II subunit RPB2
MSDEERFKMIDTYFQDTTLVNHHISSVNNFYNKDIPKVFRDMNPIKYYSEYNERLKKYRYETRIYIGGKDVDKIYYGKPVIFDEDNKHYMFPNEARLRNMTYGVSIHYDVDIELVINDSEEPILIGKTLPAADHFFLGLFPIMLRSDLCILNKMPKEARYTMGECNHDYGGYFIIDGKEKVLVPQEKFSNNMIYIRTVNDNVHDFSVEVRSVSENTSKPQRTFAIRRVAPSSTYTNGQIMVFIPNVRKSIPLFIVFRALGIVSDKDICKMIVSDLNVYSSYVSSLIPCVHDAGSIFNQMNALEFIASFTKVKTVQESYNILINYLLPHVGEMNFKAKAHFIGHMVFEMLKVVHNDEKVTDRDNFKYKRVDSSGYLMKELFIEYSNIMYENVYKKIDKEFYYHKAEYVDSGPVGETSTYLSLFTEEHFTERYVESGFRKAFKGDWGAEIHTKREGVIQSLNRLSYNSFISHLRKVNLPLDTSSKLVGPHLLHGSQWGYLDPLDTPDGGEVGIHKHMAVMCKITDHISVYDIIKWIQENTKSSVILEECTFENIHAYTKLFINGIWYGIVYEPIEFKNIMIRARRAGFIPESISISYHIKSNIIYIYSDEGRLTRPLLYYEDGKISYEGREDKLTSRWKYLIKGFLRLESEFSELNIKNMESYHANKAILEYIDNSEAETLYISTNYYKLTKDHTHLEIHPSLMFGVMGNQVMMPQHNQLPRNVFGCGQAKQAVSLYHSNYLSRIDKMGVILNYGQKPIARSRYLNYINEEEHPCGENAIVAIMCHSSYNVEDSILINESAVKRGLFRTTYYNMYETYEETATKMSSSEKRIANIFNEPLIKRTKPGYNYNALDDSGIIKENTMVDDKTVLIGLVGYSKDLPDEKSDNSIFPKKGQIGYVDKTYITENEEGKRIAKVRIREDRSPNIGDKFSSRCGQKGTIGILIPEENMPFTKDGLRPDMIINPHAIPSRMTIGQLIECIFAKLACVKGSAIDSTAFVNKGPKHKQIGDLLNEYDYHSSGNELLYNGMTGEQIESEIFLGPTYYMRLKHMVKDKINYRAAGPRTLLTRQTNQGRANDGGLRIGEMERDGLIAHGISSFLQDSMMKRGDAYSVAVCNQSGTLAIYNKVMDNFYSPSVDGPIVFDLENNATPTLMTKYGKEFSIVDIPYSFKLLMQELTAMNVQMRLITADNIDQMTSMGKKTISEVLNIEKPKNTEKEKTVTLAQLNAELSSINDEFLAKYNTLREKYKFSEPPEGSQDKYELDKLQEQYEKKRAENFAVSKKVNKRKISEVVSELVQLQADYDQMKVGNNQSGLARIRRQYDLKRDEYSGLTGDEYEPLRLNIKEVPDIPKLKELSTQNSLKAKQAQSELKLLGLEPESPYEPTTPEFLPSSPLYEVPSVNEPSPPYHVPTSSENEPSPPYHVPTSSENEPSPEKVPESEFKVVKLDN